MNPRRVLLKLGGSLITVKEQAHTPRLEVLKRLAVEIAEARTADPELQIVLGHGSGSFGHVPASKYHTRKGVTTAQEWTGFVEVWRAADALNRLVMQALEEAGLPALRFSPLAMVTARGASVETWDLDNLLQALARGLLPVIHGDVIFDRKLGGTILSTEDLFAYLAEHIAPDQLLLAGMEPGVWADFPACTRLLEEITATSMADIEAGLTGSAATDVTGGMADKVRQVMALVQSTPRLEGMIFSGETPGSLRRVLLGEHLGTVIHA